MTARALALVALLSACASRNVSLVVAPGGPVTSLTAPVNEATRSGVVKYANAGMWAKKFRRAAYEKMHDACGGPYRIVSEGPRAEGGYVYPVGAGAGAVVSASQYWYIEFACERGSSQ